jgi:hypothetical protein
MSVRHPAPGSDPDQARSRDQAKGPLLGRKSVLMGMLASGFVVNGAASAVAGTIKPIAATQPPYAPRWKAFTAYLLGQQVISPNNDVVSAKLAHTSSASYATDASKWTLSSTYALKGEGGGGAAFPKDAPCPAMPGAGRVLFDSNLASDSLLAYPGRIHPERVTIGDDPILGASRKVMTLTVLDTDTGPTENPRAQLETPSFLVEGDDVWVGWSTLFPSSWPVLPAGGWVAFASVYGPPFSGSGPNGFVIEGGRESISFSGDGPRVWQLPIVRGVWMDFAVHHVMSGDGAYGLTEIFTCTGGGTWVQQKPGGLYGLHHTTLAPGVNDGGPNNARINLYRAVGMFPSMTLKHADHKVATTCQSALPSSYPSATKPWEL